ncbi:MAG: protein-glutamate O-methyltransferase CheR [Proteobacteria bacterium]|nr:protein-glutamate O-methyltransferase CheR [Pseudomonadota bacterium]MBU1686156.1 protein-glutamate O-methyltransferase CheR [Pseudomonadota bacterium]
MNNKELEQVEIEVLIDSIRRRYGFDFSNYSQASFKRRLQHYLKLKNINRISDLIPAMLHDPATFKTFLFNLSIPVTEMFRDPQAFQVVRQKVVPMLSTYPSIKIWHAGCASGEEVYALAIVLVEEGLYDRCQIYATDFNDQVLKMAEEGIYPTERIKEYTLNYQKAGGKRSLSDYYLSRYEAVIMNSALRKRIVFANHNLMGDASFGEMQLIVCRNVLIYFNQSLKEEVLQVFAESLAPRGYLWLGTKEDVGLPGLRNEFKTIDSRQKIFQKK